MAYTNQPSVTLTLDQKKAATQTAIAAATVDGVRSMFNKRRVGFDWVWNNPHGLTPQQVFDSYGNLALGICMDDQEAIAFINKRCLLPDGSDDPSLKAYKITQGAPVEYDLTFDVDNSGNPIGTVLARPKLRVQTLAGATVTIYGDSVVADGTGMAIFPLVEADYTGTASLDGHDDSTFTVSLTRGGQTVRTFPQLITGTLTITGPVDAEFTLSKSDGTVVGTATSLPANEGDTTGSGQITVPPGDYVLTSVLAGYTDTPVNVTLTRDGLTVACGLVATA